MTTKLANASSTNLPMIAFSIARFEATLVHTELEGRQMRFFINLKPGQDFEEIEQAFNADDWAPSRSYADALRHLKGIVVRGLNAQERA